MITKIGHRGAMGYAPENTLNSFAKALDLGVDMVELDVYISIDGELVVIHDDKVDRTTDGKGYVIEKTFSQLRNLDAGNGQKIPTLKEVFDLVDRKAEINIELKGSNTAQSVSVLIEEYVKERGWKYEDFLVSSFNHYELKKFHELIPEIRIGALITGIPVGFAEFAERVNAWSVNLCMEFINKEMVDDAHARGMKVFVWTANDSDDIEKMKLLGVDGIFSNFPDRL
ncbi:MAG: hypothetical protein ACD_9C00322G0002 [uncultured bacterium]|nr:MAG: hypothetical protein ACD_9C00322G0002 [uncultured bacterium]